MQGMIHVYTGNGKGKTTAALGLSLRAAGAGKKVLIIQFLKNYDTSEARFIRKYLPMIKLRCFGSNNLLTRESVSLKDYEMAHNGLQASLNAFKSNEYDVIILDELNVAIHFKLIKLKEVLDMLEKKPKHVELIITGRYAPKELIKRADLVTNMRDYKHYFHRGIEARRGIEY